MKKGRKQRRCVLRKIVREARRQYGRGGTVGPRRSGDAPDCIDSSNPPPASTSQ